jgi:hypothetical protein
MANRSASAKIGLGLGACLVLLAGLVWLNHWRAKKSLQEWKACMVAQGERFGIDELAPPLAPNDPKARELIAAANRLRGHAFDPAYFLPLDFIAPGQARAPWLRTNLAGSNGRGPATWAQLAQEMESVRDDLDAIHAGLENPVPTSVINYHNLGMASGVVVSERAAAQWLVCEAIERMHRNDWAGAQDTLLALSALARFHRNDLTLVSQMMRVAFAGLAFGVTWPALQVPGWTEPQLAALQSRWQQLEVFTMLAATIEMERAVDLELFERVRTKGWQQVRGFGAPSPAPNLKDIFEERVLRPVWCVSWAEQDELFYLETMQRFLEALRSASQHKSWKRLSAELGETYHRIEARLGAWDSFRFIMSGMSIANWQHVFENLVRLETQRSLLIAAIALQRCQLFWRPSSTFVAYATKGWHGNFLQRLGKSFLRPPARTLRNLHAVVSRKGPGRLAAEDFV